MPQDLQRALVDVAIDEGWDPGISAAFAEVAVRRWNSFARRHPKRSAFEVRVQDLARGLRQNSPVDPLYVGPGDFARLAVRLAAILGEGGDVRRNPQS